MNQTFEPNDDSLPDELAIFEHQLKQYRPREPRLNTSLINQRSRVEPVSISSSPSFASWINHSTVRFSGVIAASWIIGAVFGSACMYFSMSSRGLAFSIVGSASTTAPRDAQAVSPSIVVDPSPSSAQPLMQAAVPIAANSYSVAPKFGLEAWPFDAKLDLQEDVSSLSIRGYMIARINPSKIGIANLDRGSESPRFFDLDVREYLPTQPISRTQLMQQYLTDLRGQVH